VAKIDPQGAFLAKAVAKAVAKLDPQCASLADLVADLDANLAADLVADLDANLAVVAKAAAAVPPNVSKNGF